MRNKYGAILSVLGLLGLVGPCLAYGQQDEYLSPTPSRIVARIDNATTVTLSGHVRKGLTADRDLGSVEDSKPLRLVLLLQRSKEQQAALNNLIARQQQPGAAQYHKWLTPKEYGAQFGIAQADIATISNWLVSQGFEVKGVLNNGSMINFEATAGGVRNTFKTDLHYFNFADGKEFANTRNPQIPAALANVVAGIQGLAPLHPHAQHTPIRPVEYDSQTHKWNSASTPSVGAAKPDYLNSNGYYVETPQDFYTIYNVNPILTGGNLGATATIGVPEGTDILYGTLSNGSTGKASGGIVNTFRNLFGVKGTLDLEVMHGAGSVTCGDPGDTNDDGEASLDVEWANALAPSAKVILMSCDNNGSNGYLTNVVALVDNNLSDIITMSFGVDAVSGFDDTYSDQIFMQAATQGQSLFVSASDAGDDNVGAAGSTNTAQDGLVLNALASSPLVTAAGGTDFQAKFDADQGGLPLSTYWSSTNSQYYGDAKGYIPETVWNGSCGSTLFAKDRGNTTPLAYCASQGTANAGTIEGGGGGISTHYAQPAYQTGIPGLSNSVTMRAIPDISLFASAGDWGSLIVACTNTDQCTSPSTFGGAGGTSFVAPQLAGIAALLVDATGSRQGLLNPALYALAKAQFTNSATATACYSNGQTNNTGVTTGLPAAACIFNDVTTSNNDEPCYVGGTDCYVNPGASYGLLSATGSSSFTFAYPAGVGYDEATGLGTINITNLINDFNQAFSSSTALKANPTSINTAQSTTLTATVTTGTPPGYSSAVPVLTGSVNFTAGSTKVGTCTLSGGTCSTSVAGTALLVGSNSITATFVGSGTYPSSTSSIVTVTVTSPSKTSQTITFGPLANQTYGVAPITLTATASSGLPVSYSVTGPATVSGSTLTITGAGAVNVTASQAGNSTYAPAPSVSQGFTVAKAALTATATSFSRPAGAANPTLTYAVTGFVNNDPSSVVGGSATLTTTAITSSPAGSYPITFSTENLTATNYTFTYVPGTLTVTGSASCTTINYSTGFTTAGLSLNGGATVKKSMLQLTDAGLFEARSAFYSSEVPVVSFTTDFTFQLLLPFADGITFTLQSNNATEVGQPGGGLGYAGIPNSAALKFDLYNNSGEGIDSTGVFINGASPTVPAINLGQTGIDLHSGHIFHVHLAYASGSTNATITDTVSGTSVGTTLPGDPTQVLGKNTYVGFTGGTGGLSAIQNILTWSFTGCPQ